MNHLLESDWLEFVLLVQNLISNGVLEPDSRDNLDVLVLSGFFQSLVLAIAPKNVGDVFSKSGAEFPAMVDHSFLEVIFSRLAIDLLDVQVKHLVLKEINFLGLLNQ